MPVVVATLTQENRSKAVKDWYGCSVKNDISLADFYDELSSGKFDNE